MEGSSRQGASVNYTNLSNGNYTLQVKYVSPGQSVALKHPCRNST